MAHMAATTHLELSKFCKGIGDRRLLGRNTWVEHEPYAGPAGESVYTITFYHTEIAQIDADGDVMIRTAGWNTRTTIDRLNQFLPPSARVSLRRGDLRLTTKGIPTMAWDGEWVLIRADGTVRYDNPVSCRFCGSTDVTPEVVNGEVLTPHDHCTKCRKVPS